MRTVHHQTDDTRRPDCPTRCGLFLLFLRNKSTNQNQVHGSTRKVYKKCVKRRHRNNPPTPTANVVVPCAFPVVSFAKLQYKFTFFSLKCPLPEGNCCSPSRATFKAWKHHLSITKHYKACVVASIGVLWKNHRPFTNLSSTSIEIPTAKTRDSNCLLRSMFNHRSQPAFKTQGSAAP